MILHEGHLHFGGRGEPAARVADASFVPGKYSALPFFFSACLHSIQKMVHKNTAGQSKMGKIVSSDLLRYRMLIIFVRQEILLLLLHRNANRTRSLHYPSSTSFRKSGFEMTIRHCIKPQTIEKFLDGIPFFLVCKHIE